MLLDAGLTLRCQLTLERVMEGVLTLNHRLYVLIFQLSLLQSAISAHLCHVLLAELHVRLVTRGGHTHPEEVDDVKV